MSKTRVAYASIYIDKIYGLNQKKSTYWADFYLRLEYEGNFDKAIDIVFVNAVEPVKLGPPANLEKKGDSVLATWRIKSEFRVDFDFSDYPFDRQKLKIEFQNANLPREDLIYIASVLKAPVGGRAFNLKGWHAHTTYFKENIVTRDEPEKFDPKDKTDYSQCEVKIIIDKNFRSIILKVLFPVIILLAILCLTYFVGADKFFVGMIIPLSVLAATVFYHIRLAMHLKADYVILLEYSYLTIYVLCMLSLLSVVLINYWHKKRNRKKIKLISYAGMITHISLCIILFSWFIFIRDPF